MLHVAIETAAFCQWSYLDELRRYADLFLIDRLYRDSTTARQITTLLALTWVLSRAG